MVTRSWRLESALTRFLEGFDHNGIKSRIVKFLFYWEGLKKKIRFYAHIYIYISLISTELRRNASIKYTV